MKNILNLHFTVSLHLMIIAVVIVFAAWAVHATKADVRLLLTENIDAGVRRISELLVVTDNNGADEIIESIIVDCPNRNEYERKLGQLGSLNSRDLVDAQQLFDSCGHFYAERKALMVAKIEREYEILQHAVDLMRAFDATSETYDLQPWRQIIDLEVRRSDMLKEQTEIQSGIISSLIEGRSVYDPEIRGYIERAHNLDESLSVLNKQIDELRVALIE